MGTELQIYKKSEKLQIWAARVRECRQSGKRVADWCEENGISKYTYYEWQRKVFDAAKEASVTKISPMITFISEEHIYLLLPPKIDNKIDVERSTILRDE